MARRKKVDDEGLLTEKVKRNGDRDRVYLVELARFLSYPIKRLKDYAKARGLLHNERFWPHLGIRVWVTPNTAMQLIVVARAYQGAVCRKDIMHSGKYRDYFSLKAATDRKNAKRDAAATKRPRRPHPARGFSF